MTRKLDAAQEGASPVLSLRLSPDLAVALAAEAKRRSTAAGGVPVSPASVARVLLERALLPGPVTSTPTPADAQLEEEVEKVLQTALSRLLVGGRSVRAETVEAARKTIRGRLLEAAQPPRQSSTPRSPARRAKAATAPPAPAPVVADDDQEAAEGSTEADEEAAAIARHDARGRAHTELARAEALRADLGALIERSKGALIEWSGRRIGLAIGVSGRSVSQFLSGATEGWPRWGDAARAWLDALPAAAPSAPSPDLQRPLFTPEEGTP